MGVQTTYSDAPDLGYPGTPATPDNCQYMAARNAEASAKIPFGTAVKYDLSAPTTDMDVLLPAAETDVIIGIVVRRQNVELAWTDSAGTVHGQYASDGYLAGAYMTVATKGRLLVTARKACVPGDKLWVRAVAGVGEFLGGLENADDSTDMIDCTNAGQWRSTAAIDGLAWLDFDFSGDLT
jgi:hypothetical protein